MKCTLCSENLPQRPGAVCAGPEHAGGQASHRLATGEPALTIGLSTKLSESIHNIRRRQGSWLDPLLFKDRQT